MTWTNAAEVLCAAGLLFERRSYGLECIHAGYRLQIGKSSAGGDELSVTRISGPGDEPSVARVSGLTSWFVRPTLAALADLIIHAHREVEAGRATDLLAALVALDLEEPSRCG